MPTWRRSAYVAVIAYIILVDGRRLPLGPEIAKVLVIYGGSLYIALIARTADERRRGMSRAIRLARQLIGDLGRKSEALEASARELQRSVESQARLAEENAELYAAAQRERSRQTQIFESTSDGIIFMSHDGRIEAANARAGDLLGFEPSAVMGVELARVASRLYTVGDGDSFLPRLHGLLAEPWTGAHGDLQQPATGRVFHWVAQPARDGAGGSSGLTFTIQDVTRTRDLVHQLEDKSRLLDAARVKADDANRAKGEFLANVSHEIRTPLSAIIGMAQHLREAAPRDEMLRRIQHSAESLMSIISDILDFSKIESRKLTLDREPFSLRETVEDAVEMLRLRAGEKGLGLDARCARRGPRQARGRSDAAAPGAAEPHRQCPEIHRPRGHPPARRRRDGAARPGVPALRRHGHGDRHSARQAGSRLRGVRTSRRIGGPALRRHGARPVDLGAAGGADGGRHLGGKRGGRGLRFSVHGPVQPAERARASKSRAAAAAIAPLTVLVAEDEEVHHALLAALLVSRGHRVVSARNGREALVELSQNSVDVALLDLQMPEMDGLEVAATVRHLERTAGGHLLIVGMTASTLQQDLDRGLAAGMDRFVTKPIARDLLFQIVEEDLLTS